MDFCGWSSTSCGTGGIYSQAWLGSVAGRQALHPTTGASEDIWCTIGTRGKWDYSRGNEIDSLLDRFTDPHWIEYRQKGCKTHHLWGELHTAWNNLFGLGNPHTSLFWFTCTPHLTHPLTPLLLTYPPGSMHGWQCFTVVVIQRSLFFIILLNCCAELSLAFDLLAAYNWIILHCINNFTSQDL